MSQCRMLIYFRNQSTHIYIYILFINIANFPFYFVFVSNDGILEFLNLWGLSENLYIIMCDFVVHVESGVVAVAFSCEINIYLCVYCLSSFRQIAFFLLLNYSFVCCARQFVLQMFDVAKRFHVHRHLRSVTLFD